MTAARAIISSSLAWINRLSPGETLDADVAAGCLTALNDIADEFNGTGSFLFREIMTAATITGVSGTLGTDWPTLSPGDKILGATVSYQAGMDLPLAPITVGQYAEQIASKATASIPQVYAADGGATVYFWPAPTGQTITLRTRQSIASFASLDTDYVMPSGYRSAFAAILSEKLAPTLLGGIPPAVAQAATSARLRLLAQASSPAIVDAVPRMVGNILTGWH